MAVIRRWWFLEAIVRGIGELEELRGYMMLTFIRFKSFDKRDCFAHKFRKFLLFSIALCAIMIMKQLPDQRVQCNRT